MSENFAVMGAHRVEANGKRLLGGVTPCWCDEVIFPRAANRTPIYIRQGRDAARSIAALQSFSIQFMGDNTSDDISRLYNKFFARNLPSI